MNKHSILQLHQFITNVLKNNPDKILEEQMGTLIDSIVHDLYWNNSMISSCKFSEIVNEIEATDDDVKKVPDIKKKLFTEIMRNLICNSMLQNHNGHYHVAHILPIYVLHGIYVKNIFSIINTSEILYNSKHQLSFINSLVCTYNFPSQYDTKCKLLSFANECKNMSDFVKKNRGSHYRDHHRSSHNHHRSSHNHHHSPCAQPSSASDCSVTTLPNSIDKIIETISKVLDTEKTELDAGEQQILDDIDNEISHLL